MSAKGSRFPTLLGAGSASINLSFSCISNLIGAVGNDDFGSFLRHCRRKNQVTAVFPRAIYQFRNVGVPGWVGGSDDRQYWSTDLDKKLLDTDGAADLNTKP